MHKKPFGRFFPCNFIPIRKSSATNVLCCIASGSFLPILDAGIGPTPIPSLVVIHQKANP